MIEYSDDVMHAVAECALGQWDLQVQRLVLVSRSENVVFRVHTASDATFALRIHRPGYHTLAELESELVWRRSLNESGIGVPPPHMTRDGEGYACVVVPDTDEVRHVGLVEWIGGVPLHDMIEAQANASARLPYFERLGGIIARIHNHSAAWRPPAGFRRHSLDADGLMGESPFWGPFWDFEALSSEQRDLALAARATLHRRLRAYGKDPETYSLIHADLHPRNVLVDRDRLQVIDLDDAGFGWHAYELAVALFHYRKSSAYEVIRDALIVGYRLERPLGDEVVDALPMFFLIRGLALLGWVHERPELRRNEHIAALIPSVCADAESYV